VVGIAVARTDSTDEGRVGMSENMVVNASAEERDASSEEIAESSKVVVGAAWGIGSLNARAARPAPRRRVLVNMAIG
jgi:hypothetical protein